MPTLALTLLIALALCGCAGVTAPTSSAPPTTPTQRTAAAEALSVERQWLGSWFRDTPVRVAQRGDGVLTIEVPREFCFDAGRSTVKPALAAVLDKLAESLRRVPQAQVALLAAPDDADVTTPLAMQRADHLREHLRSRGVAEARMARASPAASASVQLRVIAFASPL